MTNHQTELQIVKFSPADFDVPTLAETVTRLRATATRTPRPVTVEQLEAIGNSETSVLLLQVADMDGESKVVGIVHLNISYLEDRAALGPICIDKESTPRGHGTPLMEAAIAHVKEHYPTLRRIDLTNRPDHDHEAWYKKFGFIPRTEAYGDPTTVYRLPLG